MKKSAIITVIAFLSFTSSFAQITKKDFIGHWADDTTSVESECVIWLDKNDNFKFASFGGGRSHNLEILSLKYEKNSLILKTRYEKNNWVVTATFTLIDEYNMTARFVGNDTEMTVKFKKVQ